MFENGKNIQYLKIETSYTRKEGYVSDSLLELFQSKHNEKHIPINIERIFNGIVVFYSDILGELENFLFSQLNLHETNPFKKYTQIYFSSLDKTFYLESTENGFKKFIISMIELLDSANSIEEFCLIMKNFKFHNKPLVKYS